MTSEDKDRLALRPGKVAELLDVSKDTVYELIHSGRLPAIRIGRRFVVPRKALEDWITAQARHGAAVR